ncbi:MAG: ATP-binding protein [Actinomycetota bacterium]
MATRMEQPKPWRFATRAGKQAFPNDPRNAHDMRAFVAEFLCSVEVPEHITDEILMAVGEVVANACRHGRRPRDPGDVTVLCDLADVSVTLTVVDEGAGFDVNEVLGEGTPALLSPGGRGFFLMRQLMDRVDVESDSTGTIIVLCRELPR